MTPIEATSEHGGFRHEALLYAGEGEFADSVGGFVRRAVVADEPVMVMVEPRKIDLLRSHLDGDAEGVIFVDMSDVGRNPGRIISAWEAFVNEHAAAGRRACGVGEPVWPARDTAELTECQRHEQLLNAAFSDAVDFRLVCPYDVAALDDELVEAAHVSHPHIVEGGTHRFSHRWHSDGCAAAVLDGALPEPTRRPHEVPVAVDRLRHLRTTVTEEALSAGLSEDSVDRLVMAANEVATNSVCHGGGEGRALIWRDRDAVVCEIRDKGHVTDPLVGRLAPPQPATSGRGLWLVHQLCDLVQLRSSSAGTTVRLRVRDS